MAKNKKPRKKYVPKQITGPGFVQLPVTLRHLNTNDTNLKLLPHISLDNLVKGLADANDWEAVTERVNIAGMLDDMHFEQCGELVETAKLALEAIKRRADQFNTWSAATPESSFIHQVLVICDEMQGMCTRHELRDAMMKMHEANNSYHLKVAKIKKQLNDKAFRGFIHEAQGVIPV